MVAGRFFNQARITHVSSQSLTFSTKSMPQPAKAPMAKARLLMLFDEGSWMRPRIPCGAVTFICIVLFIFPCKDTAFSNLLL
jgi:hypothetical protein